MKVYKTTFVNKTCSFPHQKTLLFPSKILQQAWMRKMEVVSLHLFFFIINVIQLNNYKHICYTQFSGANTIFNFIITKILFLSNS